MVLLRRPAATSVPGLPAPSADQAAVLEDPSGVVRVVGGPGTGKSALAVHVVVDRVRRRGLDPDRCLLVAATRTAAATLRDATTAALGGTTTQPLARTLASFAIGVLRADAALRGEPAPRLLSGPEQDVVLAELLAGHASGEGRDPGWPEAVRPALGTRGFRGELRDLLMRATELGLEPDDLARLGSARGRPEWVAAARVLDEYDEVTALSRPGAYDPAWLLSALADRVDEDAGVRDRLRTQVRTVVVDDAQELTPAGLRLVRTLARLGAPLVILGDPDSAVQTFRGGDPSAWTSLGGSVHVLTRSFRLPREVATAAARVTGHIGVLGDQARRTLRPTEVSGAVEAHVLRSGAQEGAFVASVLRRAHLLDGMPWSDMAVIVRGAGRTAALRRALSAATVPVAAALTDAPVRDESAVRPLLTLLELALASTADEDDPDPGAVVDLLQSPFGGADAVSLRRLRRSLRRVELEGGGGRPADVLLADAVCRPTVLSEVGEEGFAARRIARMLAAGVTAASNGDATAESVLWAIWAAARVAEAWREQALAGGAMGARRDRDLDAVVALFDAAARFVDRLPAASPEAFLEHIRAEEVAGDSLVARAPVGDSVALLTPAAAAGREWRLVVIAGVQEGAWPDPRVRGTLLRTTDLVDAARGRDPSWRAAQAAVRHDETRLFHVALTRASDRVVVTAVRSDDEQPSPYLDVVSPSRGGQDRPFTDVERPMTMRGLVAALRRDLLADAAATRHDAELQLARLARSAVPEAHPSAWWALRTVTSDRPMQPQGTPVRVSPSAVEGFQRCGLRWLLGTRGGAGPAVGVASLGTLIHEVAAETPDTDADREAMHARLDAKWPRLGLRPGWVADQTRREAYDMVDRLATYFAAAAASGWTRVGAEVSMRVAIGRAELAGRVDRLERDDATGALRVVDYKTGSSKPARDELARHPQLGAYQVAIAEGGFVEHGTSSGGAGLLQLGRRALAVPAVEAQAPLADDEDPAWARELIEATADGMAGASVTATPDEAYCRTCPVRDSCPAAPEGEGIRL